MTSNPVKHARGVQLLLKVGNGASPEVYTAYCSINAARGITFSSAVNDFSIPDCTDPDLIAWIAREKSSLSVAASGAGILNTPDVAGFFNWWSGRTSKHCTVTVDVGPTLGGQVFTGYFHLTDFSITGDRGGKMECSITLASDGEVVMTADV